MRFGGSTERSLSYSQIVNQGGQGNIIGRGLLTTRGGLDLETGQGIGSVHWHEGSVSCEVEVDVETGRVRVLEFESVCLCRSPGQPPSVPASNGGMCLFWSGAGALEEMSYDGGRVVNSNLGDYMIPSFEDIPWRLEVGLIEHEGAGTSMGCGETLFAADYGGHRQCRIQRRGSADS